MSEILSYLEFESERYTVIVLKNCTAAINPPTPTLPTSEARAIYTVDQVHAQ